jgi:hypothetical protein
VLARSAARKALCLLALKEKISRCFPIDRKIRRLKERNSDFFPIDGLAERLSERMRDFFPITSAPSGLRGDSGAYGLSAEMGAMPYSIFTGF